MNIGSVITGGMFGHTLGTVNSWVPSGFTRGKQQQLNQLMPNELPDINSVIAAHQRGFLRDVTAADIAAACGVPYLYNVRPGSKGSWSNAMVAWDKVSELLLFRPDANVLYDARIRGIIDDTDLDAALKRIGCDIPDWRKIEDAFYRQPAVGELLIARNRGLIADDATLRTYLTRLGYKDEAKDFLGQLRFQIPGPSDLIRFMVREAFSPAIAGPLGYYNETPTAIFDWMDKQGYGEQLNILIESDGVTRNATWTDMFWAAHWQTISPSQSYEFFHRFRPNRLQHYADDFPDLQPFLLDDVRRHLRIADYPQSVRTWLAAASSTLLGFREIRRGIKMHQEKEIDLGDVDSWAFEHFRDRGYLVEDAKFQVELAKAEVSYLRHLPARRFRDETVKLAIDEILKAYEVGIIDDLTAFDRLDQMGLDFDAVKAHLSAIDSRVSRSLVTEAVNRIERDYLSGVLSYAEAQGELATIGIATARLVSYLDSWRQRRDRQRRILAAGEVRHAGATGLIDVPTQQTMLERLGFGGLDESIQIADASRRFAELQRRQQEAILRQQRQQQRELERIRKEAINLQRQVEGDIRRNTPITVLRRWYFRDQVGGDYVRSRLESGGYSGPEIDEYFRQWDAEKSQASST